MVILSDFYLSDFEYFTPQTVTTFYKNQVKKGSKNQTNSVLRFF